MAFIKNNLLVIVCISAGAVILPIGVLAGYRANNPVSVISGQQAGRTTEQTAMPKADTSAPSTPDTQPGQSINKNNLQAQIDQGNAQAEKHRKVATEIRRCLAVTNEAWSIFVTERDTARQEWWTDTGVLLGGLERREITQAEYDDVYKWLTEIQDKKIAAADTAYRQSVTSQGCTP